MFIINQLTFIFSYLFLTILINKSQAALEDAPVFYFESPGQNRHFASIGMALPVQTTSGRPSLTGVSLEQCAVVCHGQYDRCECCNGFKYNAESGECFLLKFNEFDQETEENSDDFYTYRIWGESTVGGGYQGQYNNSVEIDLTAPVWYIEPSSFRFGYSTQGWGVMPLYSGETVLSVDGYDQLGGLTPVECAEECNKVNDAGQQCDGFTYNPFQGGSCFLKKGSSGPELLEQSSIGLNNGWQFYWREDEINCNSR
eukprot:TRINITY_DN57903_c0_g1_i1.p2 TRINITY_DN57903_c0_g1~~TRINITY_DN57903_c0_g1_i1.p2  ORF type:complete len:256 (+),score=22.13 TRINITY_DN57903_c0_g1_i1:110-877(+)